MKINLEEVLSIYKQDDLNDFLIRNFAYDLTERGLKDKDIHQNWTFVGDNFANATSIDILKNGEKGVIERISNGIDAVLENEKNKYSIKSAKNADVIIKKAFPKFSANRNKILNGEKGSLNSYDAEDKIILAINSSQKSNKPTFDIIDKGTGIHGDDFKSTIMSLQGNNKIKTEKSYQIGSFGQGGSTSLSFAESTIIVSKYDNKYYFTVVKKVNLDGYKNHTYVYLTNNKNIIEIESNPSIKFNNYLDSFIESSSGTLVRMIETDITKKYRDNDITKPTMFSDYINTELFNVALPIKIIENRIEYTSNVHAQSRNAFGTRMKLQTWKYKLEKYSGTISIVHHNNTYDIEYFIILPEDEEKWGRDNECKRIYNQFNVHDKPIIYTVNGQYINGEGFRRIKNAGLNFLEYRLLVVIDLDVLGTEKYNFFTPDRSQIKNTDVTNGFIEKVVSVLSKEEKLNEINGIIAKKSLSSKVDSELIENITKNVKNLYSKYMNSPKIIKIPRGGHPMPNNEDVYFDEIKSLTILSKKPTFKKDEQITVVLKTEANKVVNQNADIYGFLDNKMMQPTRISFMNGRIYYHFDKIKHGEHNIQFELFIGSVSMRSNIYEFTVLDEISDEVKTSKESSLNMIINLVEEKELICDIAKTNDSIIVSLCLDHDEMAEVYGYRTSSEVDELKSSLIEPIVLFSLFLGEEYDSIDSVDGKNKIISSFSKTRAALS